MTAQELADFLMRDPERTIGQEEASAMLRQQAEQIEALQDAKETIEQLFKGDVAVWSLGGSTRARTTLVKIEQAIAQEQPVRSCETCLFVDQTVDQAPCNNCTTNELFADNWEPKP